MTQSVQLDSQKVKGGRGGAEGKLYGSQNPKHFTTLKDRSFGKWQMHVYPVDMSFLNQLS